MGWMGGNRFCRVVKSLPGLCRSFPMRRPISEGNFIAFQRSYTRIELMRYKLLNFDSSELNWQRLDVRLAPNFERRNTAIYIHSSGSGIMEHPFAFWSLCTAMAKISRPIDFDSSSRDSKPYTVLKMYLIHFTDYFDRLMPHPQSSDSEDVTAWKLYSSDFNFQNWHSKKRRYSVQALIQRVIILLLAENAIE